MFNKHFKPGQKVLIHLTNPDKGDDRIENISGSCQSVENNVLSLALPYAIDSDTFFPDTNMAIVSESLGMGLKAQTYFHAQHKNNSIQLRFEGDLQFFQRRPSERLMVPIGLRFSRITDNLSLARQQWQQHIHKLTHTPPDNLPPLPSGMVNLSNGGIRLGFRNTVDKGQLCLLLLQTEPRTVPICTLAEVVWTRSKHNSTTCTAGLQFLAMMAEDRKRLETFIRAMRLTVKQ